MCLRCLQCLSLCQQTLQTLQCLLARNVIESLPADTAMSESLPADTAMSESLPERHYNVCWPAHKQEKVAKIHIYTLKTHGIHTHNTCIHIGFQDTPSRYTLKLHVYTVKIHPQDTRVHCQNTPSRYASYRHTRKTIEHRWLFASSMRAVAPSTAWNDSNSS